MNEYVDIGKQMVTSRLFKKQVNNINRNVGDENVLYAFKTHEKPYIEDLVSKVYLFD